MAIKFSLRPDKDGKRKTVNLTPVKAIRLFCKECLGSARAVLKCESLECTLYPYKSGKQPERAGIGGKKT